MTPDITQDVLAAQHHCPRCGWCVWTGFYVVGRARNWRHRACHRAAVAARKAAVRRAA